MDPEINIEDPVIIVYDGDVTYSDIVEKDELGIYQVKTSSFARDPLSEDITRTSNQPRSPLGRITRNIIGSLTIYFFTFLICDIFFCINTGEWQKMVWAFFGPYYAVTGAPAISWLASKRKSKCEKDADSKFIECIDPSKLQFDPGANLECQADKIYDLDVCNGTDPSQDCVYIALNDTYTAIDSGKCSYGSGLCDELGRDSYNKCSGVSKKRQKSKRRVIQ